jgi:glucose-6-phosphate dehydrogenase assembly protein OpcA
VLLGNNVAADARSIERGLQQLWSYEAGQSQSGEPLLCSRTLNLIICFSRDEQLQEAWELLDPISSRHPCRAVLVGKNVGESQPDLQAQVSASCLMSHQGNRYLGRELVAIAANPALHDRVASLVKALLVPELPVFLWWRDMSSMQSELFDALAAHANRIIVDSGELPDAFAQLDRLSIVGQRHPATALSDLAWSRLTLWRQLTAQFFDGPMVSHLEKLTSVAVGYAPDPQNDARVSAEALLLAAWLVKQLRCGHGKVKPSGTSPESRASLAWRFERQGSPFTVQLRPHREAGRGVMSLELACGGEPPTKFMISRGEKEKTLTTSAELPGKTPVRRVVRYEPPATSEAVCRELDILGKDNLYERVLETAAELMAHV